MASERVTPFFEAHASIAEIVSRGARVVRSGSLPVAGLPRLLGSTFIDFIIN
jgi:hypothetical protein